MRSILATLIVD